MKKLTKSKSRPKRKSFRISKRNPETIEEQLKRLVRSYVKITVFYKSIPRVELYGQLINTNNEYCVQDRTQLGYTRVIFSLKDQVKIILSSETSKESVNHIIIFFD